MLRGLFITGTDTGVGKSVVSAVVMHRYRLEQPLLYWKPVQTGIEQDDDTEVVRQLGQCGRHEIFTEGFRLRRPLSPHIAARLAGELIEIPGLVRLVANHSPEVRWVVEGAGGLLVPINDSNTWPSFIAQVRLPILLVARAGLGTINHTLLTLEAIRRRNLQIAGIVMVGEPNRDNRETIEKFGNVPVIAEVPQFAHLSPAALNAWSREEFDASGELMQYFV